MILILRKVVREMASKNKKYRVGEFFLAPDLGQRIIFEDCLNDDDFNRFFDLVFKTKVQMKRGIVKIAKLPEEYEPIILRDGSIDFDNVYPLTIEALDQVIEDSELDWNHREDVSSITFRKRFATILMIYFANNIDFIAIMRVDRKKKKNKSSIRRFDGYSSEINRIRKALAKLIDEYIEGEDSFETMLQLFFDCNYSDPTVLNPKKYNEMLLEQFKELYNRIFYKPSIINLVTYKEDETLDYLAKLGVLSRKYEKHPEENLFRHLPNLIDGERRSICGKHFWDNLSYYLNTIGDVGYEEIMPQDETIFYTLFKNAGPKITCNYLTKDLFNEKGGKYRNIEEGCITLEFMNAIMASKKSTKIINDIMKKKYADK